MIRFFDNFQEFWSCIKKFEKYFLQCGNCGFVWLNPQVDYNQIPEEYFILLQRVLVDINNWCPDIEELKELDIEISHGACDFCTREQLKKFYRKAQQQEGNPDCFGKANDGYCDQFGCKYRRWCIAQPAEYRSWIGKLQLLLEVIPLQICPEHFH